MNKIKFPSDFLWGGAISAEQTEGKGSTRKAMTIYDKHYKLYPEDFFERAGPKKTIDITNNYKSDIKLWKEVGANSIRTSISWARIFPDGMEKEPSKEGVNFYKNYFKEMQDNGIEVLVTLFHFDLPMYEYEKGGWASREVWNDFLKYAKFIIREFKDQITTWFTMNEPWIPPLASYVWSLHFPKEQNDQRAVNEAYGIVMAHALVVNFFNEEIKVKYPNLKIGTIFNGSSIYPKDANNPADVKAVKYMDYFMFSGITDPMIIGKWPQGIKEWLLEMDLFPKNYKKEDLEILAKVKIDLIGLNYYAPNRVQAPTAESKKGKSKFFHYFERYNMPGRRENKFRGWEIYPEAVYDTLKELSDKYGKDKEYMLTEYGMGVEGEEVFKNKQGIIQDDYRISFIKEHLYFLNKAINDGINVIGAHPWAIMDCWSWINAFKNRYGLIEVEINNNLKRRIKKSGQFMKKLSESNYFDGDFEKMEKYMDFDSMNYSQSK
ncbi:MAG: glycoside hydrolase family 1 protein [Mycoplasmatales bacterium]|nr:glycoside hydrolase family 1 protein [Mycoplasmatales bacterium]